MVRDTGRDLSIALVGDVNFGAPIDRSNVFDLVRKDFDKFDVKFCNLEGCLFDSRVSLEFKPGWHHCDSVNIAALAELKFNSVACANNVHFGAEAIRHSLALLDRENIGHAGAGSDRNEARKPAIFESGGIRFGMLAYTSIFWPVGHSATDKQAGVATIKIHTSYQPHRRLHEMPGAPATTLTYPDEKEFEEMKNDIARLRSQVDVMVVYFHWGLSGAQELCQYQSTLGRSAIDSGADIVVGSHPHVVQGIEFYRGHPIFYSLGNFVFGSEFKPARGYRNGLVAIVELRDRQIVRVSAVPCAINDREQPALLNFDQLASMALVEDIKRLSSPFGTKIVSERNRLSLQTA